MKKTCDVYRGLSLLRLPQEKVMACPLHPDAQPSFHVYGEGASWYCFSARCRKGGDVIALVSAVKKCSMKAATLWLAQQLGLSVDCSQPGAAVTAIRSIIERARETSPRRDPALQHYLERRYLIALQDWRRWFADGRWPGPEQAVRALEAATEKLLAMQSSCRSLRDPKLLRM